MPASESSDVAKTSRSTSGSSPTPFERTKRQLVLACIAIGGGLAIAGSIDRTTGGVVLVVGWILGVASLHRLGRAGSAR